jgi:hypothetical protein
MISTNPETATNEHGSAPGMLRGPSHTIGLPSVNSICHYHIWIVVAMRLLVRPIRRIA